MDRGYVCTGPNLKLLLHLMLTWRTSVVHTNRGGGGGLMETLRGTTVVLLRHHYHQAPDGVRAARTDEGDYVFISYLSTELRGTSLMSSKCKQKGAKVHPFVHIH